MALPPADGGPLGPGVRVGDYVLERALGRGGMGAVFVGRHVTVGTRRAIKLMLGGARAQALERFQREARALAKVDRHPNIVDIHAAGLHAGHAFLVLELVEGTDLERALEAGPLPLERALRLGAAIADALAHVHAAGIVHRDLKPANVLLRAHDDSPVLTDFGIVRDEAEARITASHALVGSPQYMAPEQLSGEQARIGPASDVFALGVVLYHALTGALPFQGDSLPALSHAVLHDAPPPPSRVGADLPADVDDVVLAALEKDPARRPSAARLAAALRAVARGEAHDLPRGTSARRLWSRAPRRVRRALVAAAALVPAGAIALVTAQLAWLGPRAAALEAHAAARDLDMRLAGWRLGLAGLEAPVEAEAVAARAARLRAALPRLDPDEVSAGEALAARLDAHARLLGRGDVPRAIVGRSPLDLVVDALLLARRGDAQAARQRAEAAVERAPDLLEARVVALRLRAPLDPRGFLTGARRLPARERALVADLATAAARAALVEVLRAAPGAARADDLRRELEAVAAEAAEVGAPLDALAADKAAIVEAEATTWAARLQEAVRRGAEAEALLRCAAAVSAAPAAPPGPGVHAAVDATFDALLVELAREADRGDRTAAARVRARLLRAAAVAFYELDPARPPPRWLDPLVTSTLVVDGAHASTELILAGLRVGVQQSGRSVARYADVSELRRWQEARPRSRAARFALLQCALRDEPGWLTGPAGVERVRRAVEEVLAPGLLDDLAPCFLGEAWLVRAQAASLLRDPHGDDPTTRRLSQVVVESARAARQLVALPEHLVLLSNFEAEVLLEAGDGDGAVALWDRTVAAFGERLAAPRGRIIDNEQHCLSRALTGRAKTLEVLGRLDEALASAEEAIAAQALTASGNDLGPREVLSRLLRGRGDLERARAVILERVDAGVAESDGYAAEALHVLLATGERDLARTVLERARVYWPRSPLLDEVGGALSGARRPAPPGAR